ncbi:MAG TPA: transcription antitermination factor NusB [Mycobacteriales bacterium]|nr:transcription antitermination factor NusB [Mycobacteriales bacterium]
MPARSKARKRALDILFEADQRSTDVRTTLDQWVSRADPPVPDYSQHLVTGVIDHRESIDELLSATSTDWTLDRMPSVDRTVLRLAVYELLWCDDVPTAVAIDEAVELAKSLSTDDSPAFVNGLLARIAAQAGSGVEHSSARALQSPTDLA